MKIETANIESILSQIFFALIFLGSLTACTPKVYVIDRSSILEEEAAGTWPDLELEWKKQNVKKSPTAQKTNEASKLQKKLTRVLETDQLTE